MQVHHITPGSFDKNFGKSINSLIEYLPPDDWICLRDIDTMPLHHRVFFKQCQDIAESGKFNLVGCMTNRLGLAYQLHEGRLSDDFDIMNHIDIAHERYEQFGSEVSDSPELIAGVFMLFSKQTWEDAGRFPEGAIQINGSFVDYLFCKKVKRLGGKIGIAKGIYIFHIYRSWLANVRMGYNHLTDKV